MARSSVHFAPSPTALPAIEEREEGGRERQPTTNASMAWACSYGRARDDTFLFQCKAAALFQCKAAAPHGTSVRYVMSIACVYAVYAHVRACACVCMRVLCAIVCIDVGGIQVCSFIANTHNIQCVNAHAPTYTFANAQAHTREPWQQLPLRVRVYQSMLRITCIVQR